MASKIRGIYEQPAKSGIWYVQWFDAAGNRHREKAGTKATAIKLKAKRTTDKLEARKVPETLRTVKGTKLSDLMDDALENAVYTNGKSSVSNLRGILKALAPDFGDRDASSITTLELVSWLRSTCKAREWADGTYNQYVIQLKVMYRLGMDHGKVTSDPTTTLKRRTLVNDKPRYLTHDESDRLDEALLQWPQHVAAFQFAKHVGLRASAQFNLKWSQIDLAARTLTLPPRKNSKYRKPQVLPLNDLVHGVLAALWEKSAGSPLVFHEYHRRTYLTKPANWFPAIVKAAGVENFTWHSLRHDFASQLSMRGVGLETIQRLMTHANMSQTARYADLSPAHLQSSVNSLLRPLPAPSNETITVPLAVPVGAPQVRI